MNKKSENYHKQVKARLALGAKLVAKRGHEPVLKVTQVDQAQLDQAVFTHEVSRHVDKRGRKVR
jgi:dephospho-CoA kinase